MVRRLLQLNTGAAAGRRATDAIQESNRYAIGKGQKPRENETTLSIQCKRRYTFQGSRWVANNTQFQTAEQWNGRAAFSSAIKLEIAMWQMPGFG